MSKPLPFTTASIARIVKGIERAGKHVIGVRLSDGTMLVADKPLETATFARQTEPTSESNEWDELQ